MNGQCQSMAIGNCHLSLLYYHFYFTNNDNGYATFNIFWQIHVLSPDLRSLSQDCLKENNISFQCIYVIKNKFKIFNYFKLYIENNYISKIDGEMMETVTDFIFLGPKITADGDCSHEIKRHLLLGRKAMTNIDSLLKGRFITLLTKVHIVKAMDFFSSHVWMWESDHREGWVMKNWGFWTVVLCETLENPLDSKIKPVNPKGNQSWILIGRTDSEAEAPILWAPDE